MQYFQKDIETMSKADKRALQSERLVNIVKYAYENQAPYRAKMDAIKLKPEDIKSIDDIYKLPFTVKQDLRDNYPFGMMARPKRDLVRLHASSATTGKLTVAGYTQKDIDVWAECAARCLVMAGADKNSVVHVSYGYGLFTGGLGMRYAGEKLGGNTDFVYALPTAIMKPLSGSGARAMMLDTFNTYGVDSFAGFTSSIVQGSTETTFYVLAVYFGAIKISNTRSALPLALFADFMGITSAVLLAYMFYQ